MEAKTLAFQFAIGSFVMERNLNGVTDEESLQPPRPGGNTMNWIVGHVVRTRNQALAILGEKPMFDDSEFELYGPGMFDTARALPLGELQRRFDALGQTLAKALGTTTEERFSAAAPFSPTSNPNETVGSLMASIAFHEAYHLGQTGLSRRLLGKPGALLAPGEVGH